MEKKLNYFINLTFLIYFIVLFAERAYSIISSAINLGFKTMYSTAFGGYTNTVVILSLVAFLVYFVLFNRDSIKAICKKDQEVDFKKLCIASGIILVSGMIHTEYTIAPIQFGAYGVLIVGLLLKFILINKTETDKVNLWLAFAYLVSFSMAIPVMYKATNINGVDLFHALEAVTSLCLVAAFTLFIYSLFNGKYGRIFDICVFVAMVLLDASLIIWRWKEEINWFVLIFASVSAVLFITRAIYKKAK